MLLFNEDAYVKINEFLENNLKVDHIITDPPYNISKENNFQTYIKEEIFYEEKKTR